MKADFKKASQEHEDVHYNWFYNGSFSGEYRAELEESVA